MPLPSVTFRSELDPLVRKELDQFDSELTEYLRQEHDDDGKHGHLTAQSVTVDGPVTITGGPVTIDGVPITGGGGAPAAHHVSHETGGADAITALNGAVITTGTVADARLSSNVALKTINNNFVAQTLGTGSEISGTGSVLHWIDPASAANQRRWRTNNYGDGGLRFEAMNDALTVLQGSIFLDRSGSVRLNTLYERARNVPVGEWTTFTPTVTVDTGSVTGGTRTGQYMLVGQTMFVAFIVTSLTLAGSPSEVRLSTPFVSVGAERIAGAIPYFNGSVWIMAIAHAVPGESFVRVSAAFVNGGANIWGTAIVRIG